MLGAEDEVALMSGGRVLAEGDQTAEPYLFDTMGSANLVGRCGDGPGEFRSIDVLTVSGDTVFAYDRTLNRVSVFDPNGSLLRSFAINVSWLSSGSVPQGVWAIDSDHLDLYSVGLKHRPIPRDMQVDGTHATRDPPSISGDCNRNVATTHS